MRKLDEQFSVERLGKEVLISFSCGKDSIAAWLACREQFDCRAYYMYLVPGLEFVEDNLAYYERFFGQRIIRMPHPSLYRWLGTLAFQAPDRLCVIERAGLPRPTYDDVSDAVSGDLGKDYRLWTASGVRQADSPIRRMHFKKKGPFSEKRKIFYPVWDWLKEDMLTCFLESGVKLPRDYDLFGRSFDGLDFQYVSKIKRAHPRDYARILEWFPFVDMEIYRYERWGF